VLLASESEGITDEAVLWKKNSTEGSHTLLGQARGKGGRRRKKADVLREGRTLCSFGTNVMETKAEGLLPKGGRPTENEGKRRRGGRP